MAKTKPKSNSKAKQPAKQFELQPIPEEPEVTDNEAIRIMLVIG